jgi:ribose 5-phosphate isomerase B
MKISIGADHRGFPLKSEIIAYFTQVEWLDVGTNSAERTDYPLYAKRVCKEVLGGNTQAGILVCGSGVGVSIAANRFKGIYAALCWNRAVAQIAKEDDKANVLVIPADFVSTPEAFAIVKAWLDATFKGGRYQERLTMIDEG